MLYYNPNTERLVRGKLHNLDVKVKEGLYPVINHEDITDSIKHSIDDNILNYRIKYEEEKIEVDGKDWFGQPCKFEVTAIQVTELSHKDSEFEEEEEEVKEEGFIPIDELVHEASLPELVEKEINSVKDFLNAPDHVLIGIKQITEKTLPNLRKKAIQMAQKKEQK